MAAPGEIAALGILAAAALAVVLRAGAGSGARAALLGALAVLAAGSAALFQRTRPDANDPPPRVPGRGTVAGYVGSGACVPCHAGEHASFARTYHRTMTQVATPETVRAPLDGRPLDLDGRTVRLARRDGAVWATLPDPDGPADGPDVTRRVVLATGSHREQAYWVAGRLDGDLRLVPFVWMIESGAFTPRRDAFLTPPGAPLARVRWASSCIACHAVAGEPRHDPIRDAFDTRAAELGVACEACHGPGAAHADRHRDPVTRYLQHGTPGGDPTIVHPRRLDPARSAAVCGQCHAYAFPRDEAGWWTDGYARSFRAGDRLEPSRWLIAPNDHPSAPVIDAPADAIYWPDGAVRVGGREYNGLVASACYLRGAGDRKMTCLSCHAMHAGDPAGQIAPDRDGDRGCTSCHDPGPTHGRHAAGSPGNACVACHMPRTSYALVSAVRSHRIDSPRTADLASGKPNACNLCHLDRTVAWTSGWLGTWYGQPDAALPEARRTTAAGLHDGIAGDAGVRALVADALGRPGPSRGDFAGAVLEAMRRDPYAVVRTIAERSLLRVRRVPGTAPDDALGLDPGGSLDPARLSALLAARDTRAITIAE